MSAHNSLSVTRNTKVGDAGGTIQTYGVFFNLAINRAEGMQAAVRNLVELSTIEVLGKLAEVPYWRCLQIEQTNPAVEAQARAWFTDMSEREQRVFVQRARASQGLYDAPITGERDETTKGAVARYQADNGLIADGRINYDLYASLIQEDLALGRQPNPTFGQPVPASAAALRPNPLTLTLATPSGSSPVYQVNQSLELTAIASQDSYVYCYYQDGGGSITRIYPNQFQPDAYVIAGRALAIPGEAGFDIVFDRHGASEQVLCLAALSELGVRLPPQLQTPDLAPMPVRSLDEVATAYRQLGNPQLAEARLPIRVQEPSLPAAAPVDQRPGPLRIAGGYAATPSAPTISLTISSWSVSPVTRSPAARPRRRTRIRSATAKMSTRLWEMKITPTRCCLRRRINSRTLRCSGTPSAAVGSSMIRTEACQ
jgi:peptidoglycan hydrolase-like protein with peptidoglycan-binding domain